MSIRSAGLLGILAVALALVGLAGCSESESGPERAGGTRPGSGSPTAGGEELLERLRAGGAVIVFRHAATDRTDDDDPRVDLGDCSTQRNLTDDGRADARRIGGAFRALRIPVGSVWASPYCRARDTAELAFGRAEVIDGLERLYPVLDEAADRRLGRLIRDQAPAAGEPNLVIAAHGVYPSALQPAVTLDEGGAAIYSLRDDDVALLGEVGPDDWAALAGGARAADQAAGLGRVAERVQRSVVSVRLREDEHAGAGFRVAIEGIVVTNAHTVGDADEVSVVLEDGTRRRARVLGRDPRSNTAALELADDSRLPPLHSGSGLAAARPGQPVVAVGSARGSRPSTISGSLLALDRPVRLPAGAELRALATDAAIDPASSGGPLVNAHGEVLGVSTSTTAPNGGRTPTENGFAIPVDVARSAALAIVERSR